MAEPSDPYALFLDTNSGTLYVLKKGVRAKRSESVYSDVYEATRDLDAADACVGLTLPRALAFAWARSKTRECVPADMVTAIDAWYAQHGIAAPTGT